MAKSDIELIKAKVGHARFWPKKNSFLYKVFYVKILVTESTPAAPRLFSFNKWNIFSIYLNDHGAKDKQTSWFDFMRKELNTAKIPFKDDYKIYMIAHPRILGYAFNPISYWLIVDADNSLRAVFCEVRNTFKQSHNYMLAKSDNSSINEKDVLLANKKLYVSPFNKIEGHYEFTFSYAPDKFKSVINYYDATGRHILNTYMGGESEQLTSGKILKSVTSYPAMTVVVVLRIHWQAVRLRVKGVRATLKTKPKVYKNNKTSSGKNKPS